MNFKAQFLSIKSVTKHPDLIRIVLNGQDTKEAIDRASDPNYECILCFELLIGESNFRAFVVDDGIYLAEGMKYLDDLVILARRDCDLDQCVGHIMEML